MINNTEMAHSMALSLPALSAPPTASSTRYSGVPRRYEETRPVMIQGYAHRKILGLGHELHKKTTEKAELEKLSAIRDAEQAVWAEAEQIKVAAVQKCRDECVAEQDRVVKKMTKAHDKALKEEALKVEMAMQKLAIEQVKQERLEADNRLKEAVKRVEETAQRDRIAAVEAARKEEISKATEEKEKMAKLNKEKYDLAMRTAAEDKQKALKALQEEKDRILVEKVRSVEERERKIMNEKLQKLTKMYEEQITQLKSQIHEKCAEIEELLAQISALEIAKKNVECALVETKESYQDFINRVAPFEVGQSDFLLHPIYVDEVGKVEQSGACLKNGSSPIELITVTIFII
ncbi:hypothetical protein KUTeg_005140 [Tegillarca granosa]|uniref:Uncharacterized protein n=1 Tax=Tegillarca granosa TaxID=220873 RepID=A0ABQ9FKN5_TEGGR|nr:hypothetical protein KUTeg_005140 [Tegillarca granosa]